MMRLSFFVANRVIANMGAVFGYFCLFLLGWNSSFSSQAMAANNITGGNPTATTNFLRWKDQKGTIHFTDDINTVPEDFRNKIEIVGNAYALLNQKPRATTYSFRPNAERITITAKLNDKMSVKLLLNIDDPQSFLIPKVAKEMGFDLNDPEAPKYSMGKNSEGEDRKVPVMKIENFDLQGRVVKNFYMAVDDIAEKDICSGILGKDFFNHFQVNFNRESGKLVLTEKPRQR